MTIFVLPFLFVHREVARGVTDRGVGSGALLGAWPCSTIEAADRDATPELRRTLEAKVFFTGDIRARVFSTGICLTSKMSHGPAWRDACVSTRRDK